MDKKNRWGIPKITNLAHEKFHELAGEHLCPEDIELWNSESGSRGFVAHNSPDDTWQNIVEFEPDPTFYSQITIGLAVEPGETPEVLAKILICREKSHEFTKVVWRPNT